MHACLSWGGMLAFALTFPLVFGWIHFESLPDNAEIYRVFVMGFPVEQFPVHSLSGFLHFNLLNISAVVLLVGLVLSVKLRMSDKGEFAIQTFADDVFPVLLLFAVCITGLMLTVSAKFLAGSGFQFIGMTHAASVIGLLLYLPFGKLFHIIQRPLSLGVSFYKEAGLAGPAAPVAFVAAKDYASQLHVDDLKTVLDRARIQLSICTLRPANSITRISARRAGGGCSPESGKGAGTIAMAIPTLDETPSSTGTART